MRDLWCGSPFADFTVSQLRCPLHQTLGSDACVQIVDSWRVLQWVSKCGMTLFAPQRQVCADDPPPRKIIRADTGETRPLIAPGWFGGGDLEPAKYVAGKAPCLCSSAKKGSSPSDRIPVQMRCFGDFGLNQGSRALGQTPPGAPKVITVGQQYLLTAYAFLQPKLSQLFARFLRARPAFQISVLRPKGCSEIRRSRIY